MGDVSACNIMFEQSFSFLVLETINLCVMCLRPIWRFRHSFFYIIVCFCTVFISIICLFLDTSLD